MNKCAQSIGVDFGGTSIKIGVCAGSEILCIAEPIPTQQFTDTESIIKAMCDCINELRTSYPSVCAVGLGMPGWVDFANGILGRLVNVPAFQEATPVRELMSKELGIPVFLDNDANCMAYAEWKLGAGVGCESVVSITLGTGIGGGIIIGNQMLRGKTASAGELGMCSIDYRGKAGPYGNRGGIEEYLGNREMTADAIDRYAAVGVSKTADDCTPYALELAARAGDEIAAQVYTDYAEKLACLIMNLMYSIVPEKFILGGGVAKANDLLFEPLDRFLKAQLMPAHYAALQLESAQYGSDAGLLGAALMAYDESNK